MANRAPIIFVHGVGISHHPYQTIFPIKKVMKQLGYQLFIAKTPAVASLDVSADILKNEIERLVPEGPFHLVGHSMGGLISRLVVNKHNLADRVLSVTTLSTPNRGSKVADWLYEKITYGRNSKIISQLLKLFGNSLDVVKELTTEHITTVFNKIATKEEQVKYFSMGFYIPKPRTKYTLNPYLLPASILNEKLGRPLSDGPVDIESAKWGIHLGNMPGDHYSETAPLRFGGKTIYKEVFATVTKNLDLYFP